VSGWKAAQANQNARTAVLTGEIVERQRAHCGESYLTAETVHEIDRIRKERFKMAVERWVAVAQLG